MIAADEIIMFFAGAWMMSAGFGWLPRLPKLGGERGKLHPLNTCEYHRKNRVVKLGLKSLTPVLSSGVERNMNGLRISAFLYALASIEGPSLAQTLTPADAEFLVSITGAGGVRQTVHSSVVPLLPERACYEWRIRIGSDEKLVKATEVFTLPGAPKQWGGVDENSYSASQLSGDRTVAETTLFFSPTDGWISNGWCVADGDPVGQYSIKVHVGDRMVHEFSFTVENVLAPQP